MNRLSFLVVVTSLLSSFAAQALEPLPDKLVVLTFDDSSKSHFTVARPVLLKYKFGATFFITEGFDFKENKKDYMTWEEIAQLHKDGFEIGNHTRDHLGLSKENVPKIAEQLGAINARCKEHGIPPTTSFAWPGNALSMEALAPLRKEGILFARRGGAPEFEYKEGRGIGYEPGLDHPLLIPSAGDARPDWTLDNFIAAVEKARFGRIAAIQFHGVPDTAHAWVNSTQENFEAYMKYLATHGFTVIAMRDLAKYVDPNILPGDPQGAIKDRQTRIAAGKDLENFRKPKNEDDLRYWLQNMHDHGFTHVEMSAATGLSVKEVKAGIETYVNSGDERKAGSAIQVLPYPGGRHPRIGFLEGAIRPQREIKVSVFAPWKDGGYAVADVPEAIWVQTGDKPRELLYLAHTHVPTIWDKQNITLEPLEWQREKNGSLKMERKLTNGVVFGTQVKPTPTEVRLEMWLTNGTREPLKGLLVQNCVMLKSLRGFEQQTADNKVIQKPYVACKNPAGDKWIISAWEPCVRPWGNPPCPCLHSDPQFPDCNPGQTVHLRGWLSFYEGKDLATELKRIDATKWQGERGASAP
ncbi:MAG: polysaccharide deacetylase family protein [Planctomycetales bacterium]|nr:polysaccharide deacetylase family protein [Planctomycetales bacterium]